MAITIMVLCIVTLVLLITWLKLNPFLAFLLVSLAGGLLLGVPVDKVALSVQKGIGDILGGLAIIICCGAMMGKLVAESGAARKISSVLMQLSGGKYIQWALLLTGFIIGIPLFYSVGFMLLMPLVYTIAFQYGLSAVKVAIPLLSALSVAQGYLPPHPSPAALMVQFGAPISRTFFFGVLIAIPAMIVSGPLFSKLVKVPVQQNSMVFRTEPIAQSATPGTFNAFFSALLPVFMILFSISGIVGQRTAAFISDPSVLMLGSLCIVSVTLGLGMGKTIRELMDLYGAAVKDIAMILLVMGGAGALKQVFIDGNINEQLAAHLSAVAISPLILGWMIAAAIRVCLGSATIAGLTTAGILLPMMKDMTVDPSLMVLSIGSGSLMFSHVNDPAFWMFKEYLGLSFRQTVLSWSLMETIVAVMGLFGVLIISHFV